MATPSPRDRTSPFVLWHRVRLYSDQLLMLADELELACELDAVTASELERLLFDGGESPMLNPAVPVSELSSLITSIRFGILTSQVELPDDLPRLPD